MILSPERSHMRFYGFIFCGLLAFAIFLKFSEESHSGSSLSENVMAQPYERSSLHLAAANPQNLERNQVTPMSSMAKDVDLSRPKNNFFSSVREHRQFLLQKAPTDELIQDHETFFMDSRLVSDQGQVFLIESQFDKKTNENLGTRIAIGNQLIVKFSEDIANQELIDFSQDYDLKLLRKLEVGGAVIFEMKTQKILAIQELKNRMTHDPKVFYVTYNDLIYSASLPNDPGVKLQWAINNVGIDGDQGSTSLVDSMRGFDTGVVDFWKYNTDCRSTPIAIIDTGVDTKNSELVGQIDFDHARNFGSGGEKDVHDTIGHGTHVAGIIAARGSNLQGISGICQTASIIPIKLGDGSAFTSEVLGNALNYASQTPAKIVNVSLLVESDNPYINDGISSLERRGKLIVASAGNNAIDIDRTKVLPAGNPSEYLISVAASSFNGELASFSNFGKENVDIAAPGDQILSLGLSGDSSLLTYSVLSGTSQSAPYVTASLALLWSYVPNHTDALEIKRILLESARNIKSHDKISKARVMDLSRMIEYARPRVEFLQERSSRYVESDGSIFIAYQSLPSLSSASHHELVFNEESSNPDYFREKGGFQIRLNNAKLPLIFKIKASDDYGYAGQSQEVTIYKQNDGSLSYIIAKKIDRLRQVDCELEVSYAIQVKSLYSGFVNDRAECLIRCQTILANEEHSQAIPICKAENVVLDLEDI